MEHVHWWPPDSMYFEIAADCGALFLALHEEEPDGSVRMVGRAPWGTTGLSGEGCGFRVSGGDVREVGTYIIVVDICY